MLILVVALFFSFAGFSGESAWAQSFYPIPTESCADQVEAAQFFDGGTSLLEKRRFGAALLSYERAYAACPRAAVLPNIAACLVALDRIADAANALSAFVAGAAPSVADKRERRRYIEKVRTRLGEVELSGNRRSGRLFIDGRLYLQRLPERMFLEPGAHRIALESPEGKRTTEIVLAAGERRRIELMWPRSSNSWRGFARVDVVADDTVRGAVFAPGIGYAIDQFLEIRVGPLLSANFGAEVGARVGVPIAGVRIFADIGAPTLWVDHQRQSHMRGAVGVAVGSDRLAFSVAFGGARLMSMAESGNRRLVSLVSLGLTVLR